MKYAIITGFVYSSKKDNPLIDGIYYGFFNSLTNQIETCGIIRRMSDNLRKRITNNKDKYFLKVVKISNEEQTLIGLANGKDIKEAIC